ncbi:hypothetical protein C2G38_2190702 [Gigaspora rosea]|uniref:Uncharacterized protein n=1 Tax=Gigaspora rosea TaxID=44941 RepID=A0A397V0X3_9GLOM|nr:hypothetical protein C2G38_2190702 [Gigaspora rosea]
MSNWPLTNKRSTKTAYIWRHIETISNVEFDDMDNSDNKLEENIMMKFSESYSKSTDSEKVQASLDCKIIELTDEFGKNIHYHLHEDELQSDNSSEYQNGFDIIMRSAWSILNIANWIQRHEGGWSTQKLADSEEKQFIIALSEALWYIDIHDSTKLEERSFHISNLFYEFLGKANPESYKESRKPFDASELNLHCQTLISYATSTWIRSSKFNWLYDAYDKLIVAISNYVNFLHRQREITASNHANEVPIRSIEKAASKPISLEKYLPTELKQRLRFIQGLSQAFTFRIGEYRYNSGNGTYNSIFVWKVEEGASEAKLVQETTRITSELQNDVPQYHTRIMRANYLGACVLLLPNIKSAPLRTIYRMLTGDMSAAETANEKKVDARVKLALELGDPDITIDL